MGVLTGHSAKRGVFTIKTLHANGTIGSYIATRVLVQEHLLLHIVGTVIEN